MTAPNVGVADRRRGQNLILNGGFEDGAASALWTPADATHEFTNNPANAHGGNWYSRLLQTGAVGCSLIYQSWVPVIWRDTVDFGGWVFREAGDHSATVIMEGRDAQLSGGSIVSQIATPVASTGSWVFQRGLYVVPAGVAFVRLQCQLSVSGTVDTQARFDDLHLIFP